MAKGKTAPAAKKTMTKSAFVAHLAEKTELSKKQVESVLEEIVEAVKHQLSKGPGKFVFPGLARMTLTRTKAVKGGVEKVNPLNGQKYITKDKPAQNRVNMRPLKAVKEALK